jgi:hypothetical protein
MSKIIIKETDWARCPTCNKILVSNYVLDGFWYIEWQSKNRFPPVNLPEKLCLDHPSLMK